MEDLSDIKSNISNYEELDEEEKIIALENVYKKQLKTKEINRTLQEIIEKQIEEKENRKPFK